MENVNQIINVDFFIPYNKQFGNVDMNWDVLINMNDEGEKRGAKVQFKDILGIGVAYNF